MKHAGTLLTVLVFAFWGTMNALVVIRERRVASLDQYRAGVTSFLGNTFFRERWMSVYRKGKYIGYTGGTMEKTLTADGMVIWQTLESRVEAEPIGAVELSGTLVSDQELRPTTLNVNVRASAIEAHISGKRSGNKFVVQIKNSLLPLPSIELPLEELFLGDALAPSLPVAGFKVGDKLDVPCFDPITFKREIAQAVIVSRAVKELDGVLVDSYQIETIFKGVKSSSWVNESGELLLQEFGPPLEDYVLRRTTHQNIERLEKK